MRTPVYCVNINDLFGNVYRQYGVGLKLVPAGEDATNTGVTLVEDVSHPFFKCDIESTNLYDLYLHRSGSDGYQLLRSNLWLVGGDFENKILERRKFRVGAGTNVLKWNIPDQVVSFNVRNWNNSVQVSGDAGFIVESYRYEPGFNSLRLVVSPTNYAEARKNSTFRFIKMDTGEVATAYAYVV